jgi:2-methylaconitate cis-trans-isomerase PrpF
MNLQINDKWQSVYTLSGIAVGTAVEIQNQSSNKIWLAESTEKPLDTKYVGGELRQGASADVTQGSQDVWVRAADTGFTGEILVEAVQL